MAKVVLDNVSSLSNAQSALTTINNNSDTIEEGFENTLSRDGATPNQMAASLDMNSNRILNLPTPLAATEPLRLEDLNDFVGGTLTVQNRSLEEDARIYDAEDNGIANFVADGGTDNTPMWNTFMLAVQNGTVPPFSTLRFKRRDASGSSFFRFASRPIQMASGFTLEGVDPNSMWFIRDYQPGHILNVTGTAQDSSKGATVSVSGTLTDGHTVGVAFGTPSVTISKLIATDTPYTLSKYLVAQINANATLAAANITALQGYTNGELFTIIFPGGSPVVTEVDPDSNLVISDPISVLTSQNPTSTVTKGQIVGVYSVGGTANANGTYYAGYVGSDRVLLVGAPYDFAWSSGGNVLTSPLEPFIELGPQSVNDVYATGQQIRNILIYAGASTLGGIGIDVGSHAVGSTIQGCSYRPLLTGIQVTASTGGKWWTCIRLDGSNSLPDPGFEGCRDPVVSDVFVSGFGTLFCDAWLKGIGAGFFKNLHIVDFGTEVFGGLFIEGTDSVKTYTTNISGPTIGRVTIGAYVNNCVFSAGGTGIFNFLCASGVSTNTFVTGNIEAAPTLMKGEQNKIITGSKVYSMGDTFAATAGGYDFTVDGTSRLSISSATGGAVSLKGTTVLFPNISTTASAANAFLNSGASNSILRSTSVGKYKTNRNKISAEDAYKVLDQLDPITYNSLAEADDKERTYVGMIAEEVHDQTAVDGKSPLVQYAEDTPDGLMYDRLALYLIPIIKDLKDQIKELKAKE